MSITKRQIEVTFQKEGIHKYPAALTDPNLADVAFLGHPHRHIFQFRVRISVQHNDRDIEFIQFKRWLESLYSDSTLELNFQSCEMLAEALIGVISQRYNRSMAVSVFEDNENGAYLEYEPTHHMEG